MKYLVILPHYNYSIGIPVIFWSNSISMMQNVYIKDMQHRSVSAIKVMREMAIQRQMSHIEIPVVFTCVHWAINMMKVFFLIIHG